MFSTSLFVVLLCLASSARLPVSGLQAEGLDAGGEINKEITILNERILSKIPRLKKPPKFHKTNFADNAHTCGGLITETPGQIQMDFYFRHVSDESQRCTWKIQAPETSHVFVTKLQYKSYWYPAHRAEQLDDYYDAPVVQIFDGSEAKEDKRFFSLGEATLNGTVSTGNELTVTADYKKSRKFSRQRVDVTFAFVRDEKLKEFFPSTRK